MEDKKSTNNIKPNSNQEQVDYDYISNCSLNGYLENDSTVVFSTIFALATWLMLIPAFKNINWLPAWLKCLISIILSVMMMLLALQLIVSCWEFLHKLHL